MSNNFSVDIVGYHAYHGQSGPLDQIGLKGRERSEEFVRTGEGPVCQ